MDKNMIVLLTPTGARKQQIEICAKLMQGQDYKGEVTWIIIDDAEPRTTDFITETFRENWKIVKLYPSPSWKEGQNTQGRNMAAGINYIKTLELSDTDPIFIIEDDDYYTPPYIRAMITKIKGYELAGERNSIYYNVTQRRWIRNGNDWWSSLFQTVFTKKAIPILEKIYSEKFIDLALFKYIKNKNLFNDGDLAVGIKGMPGRKGIGAGHTWINNMTPDPDMIKLKEFTGKDFKYYESFYK